MNRSDSRHEVVEAVLFDADGVVQRPRQGWLGRLEKLSGVMEEAGEFVKEIFAVEQPSLSGEGDFRIAIDGVLESWGSSHSVDEVINVFRMIDIEQEVLSLVYRIRQAGTPCYLVSNQEVNRATYMSEELGLANAFDSEFYSYQMVAKKPELEYFKRIIELLEKYPPRILLIDDKQENIDSAQSLGLKAELFHVSSGVESLLDVLDCHNVRYNWVYGLHINAKPRRS